MGFHFPVVIGALFGSSALVISSDAPSWMRIAGRILHPILGDCLSVCNATADDVEIEAAIAAVVATGAHGKVVLVGAKFECTGQIDAVTDVDVEGSGCEIELTSDNASLSTLYASAVTNSRWKGITFRRTGANGSGNILITGTGTAKTFVVEDCPGYNDIALGSTGLSITNGALATIIGGEYYSGTGNHVSGIFIGNPAAEDTYNTAPTLYRVYGKSRATGLTGNHGIDLDNSSATLYYCTGKASDAKPDNSYGIRRAYRSNATTIGCTGIGGDNAGDSSDTGGFLSEGTAAGYSIADIAKPGEVIGTGNSANATYGMRFMHNASTAVVNPTILYGNSPDSGLGISIEGNASPNIQGGIVKPMDYTTQWSYDDANNGRFRPFGSIGYQIIGLEVVVVNAAAAGAVLDIGTNVAGNEVYNNQAIDATGTFRPVLTKAVAAADGYLYATPSVVISDGDVIINYIVVPDDDSNYSVWSTSTGGAVVTGMEFVMSYNTGAGINAGSTTTQFIGCTFNWLTLRTFVDLSATDWSMIRLCTFKNANFTTGYPIFATDHGNKIIGYLLRNSGTATITAAATSIVVNHGLALTPTSVILTLTNNPTNPALTYWVDTLTATQFTVNISGVPGNSVIFNWRASVGV